MAAAAKDSAGARDKPKDKPKDKREDSSSSTRRCLTFKELQHFGSHENTVVNRNREEKAELPKGRSAFFMAFRRIPRCLESEGLDQELDAGM